MKVAFFGMGAMGLPMAKNLLRAGHEVHTAVHRSTAFVLELQEFENFRLYDGKNEAARGVDAVITILPGDAQVREFLMDEGFAENLTSETVLVDMSSCMTQTIQEVENYYKKYGLSVVDAPVSGGTSGAKNGTLTIFASGEQGAMEKIDPLFDVMGKTIFRLGSCGMGKAYKNLNNLLLAVNVTVVGEVFRIVQAQNIDMDLFYDVICASSGASTAFEKRWKKMQTQTFGGGFKLSLSRKDLKNALSLASDTPTPLASMTYELMLANSAFDNQELAAMCKLFEIKEG